MKLSQSRCAFQVLVLGFLALSVAASSAETQETELTTLQARAIIAPLYDALNGPTNKDVVALLAKATNSDYRSCSTNADCLNRTQLATQFKIFGGIIPDLRWRVLDVWTAGNRIVVRGEASGTPVAPLFGAVPTGRPFKTISIDMFTVANGKLSSAYHVENWVAAIEQIKRH